MEAATLFVAHYLAFGLPIPLSFPPRASREEAQRDLDAVSLSLRITERWVEERRYVDDTQATLNQLGADRQAAHLGVPLIELGYEFDR